MNKRFLILILFLSLLIIFSCSKKVERIEPDKVVDLSGYWNDTDSRLVSEEMIKDCVLKPWLKNFQEKHNRKPVIIVGEIVNKSHEHISSGTFIKDIEKAFINRNIVRVVASADERKGIRFERISQQAFASPETRKKLRNELGADFILLGSINSIVDENKEKQLRFYQINLELIDIETTEKVWIGEKEIKKIIK